MVVERLRKVESGTLNARNPFPTLAQALLPRHEGGERRLR